MLLVHGALVPHSQCAWTEPSPGQRRRLSLAASQSRTQKKLVAVAVWSKFVQIIRIGIPHKSSPSLCPLCWLIVFPSLDSQASADTHCTPVAGAELSFSHCFAHSNADDHIVSTCQECDAARLIHPMSQNSGTDILRLNLQHVQKCQSAPETDCKFYCASLNICLS